MKRVGFWVWPVIILLTVVVLRALLVADTKSAGEILYDQYCLNCHQEEGKGLGKLVPPLALADYWEESQSDLACIIKKGMDGPIVVNGITYDHPMPGNRQLSPSQILQLINFINSSWGNEIPALDISAVNKNLETCQP